MAIFGRNRFHYEGKENQRRQFLKNPLHALLTDLTENCKEDREDYPEQRDHIDLFAASLRNYCSSVYGHTWYHSGDSANKDAAPRFFITEDHMCALACILPPSDDGEDITMERFQEDLFYEGISYGILTDRIEQYVTERRYLHIFPVAIGEEPQGGKSGTVTEFFERHNVEHLEIKGKEELVIDFAGESLRSVSRHEVICRIETPELGKDGKDISGRLVQCGNVHMPELTPGENTELSEDQLELLSTVEGLVYFRDGQFGVKEMKVFHNGLEYTPNTVFNSGLEYSKNTVHVPGAVFVNGDVKGGTKLEADDDIIITGKVYDAQVISAKGSIRVHQGIEGVPGKTFLRAEKQIQTPLISQASVIADGYIIADTIVDSDVTSGDEVHALGGRGALLGGHIYAKRQILCKRIGNISGKRTKVTVGVPEEDTHGHQMLKRELNSTQEVISSLWSNISRLHTQVRLNEEQRKVLMRLVEQKDLYTRREGELKTALQSLEKTLQPASYGRIICQELQPVVEVQNGGLSAEYKTREFDCRICVYGNKIVLR